MNLKETQALFWEVATGKRGYDQSADNVFSSTGELPGNDRLQIYSDMYFLRQLDALREDFPKIAALLGDEEFSALGKAYVTAHPSEHPSLSQFGRKFSEFVSTFPDVRPDARALAQLEWARAEMVEAADSETAPVDYLTTVSPQVLPFEVWTLIPAFRLLRLPFAVTSLWQALEDDRPAPVPQKEEEAVAVWRKGFEIFHVRVGESEALAIEEALAGATVSELCECFENETNPEMAALKAFGSWFSEGWISKG